MDEGKYLVIDDLLVAYGTEADLVSEAAQYDTDYEILDEDELPLDLLGRAKAFKESSLSTERPLSTDKNAILDALTDNANEIMEEESIVAEGGNGTHVTEAQVEIAAAAEDAPVADVASEPIVETPEEDATEAENDGSGSEETQPAADTTEEAAV